MIKFTIARGSIRDNLRCGKRCPSTKFFKPEEECTVAPDIYDDYFRRYSSQRYKEVQERGIVALNGVTPHQFWSYLVDLSVYVGNGVLDDRLIDSYEEVREHIETLDDESLARRKKKMLMMKLGDVHKELKHPGEEIDSLKSFGSFVHLLTAGLADYMGKSNVKIEIVIEEEPGSEEALAPFMNFLENKDS